LFGEGTSSLAYDDITFAQAFKYFVRDVLRGFTFLLKRIIPVRLATNNGDN
jgi:hypothetical protein